MACDLSLGRQEVCKESIGGLQGVYFFNYPSTSTGSYTPNFTLNTTTNEVTAFPSGSTVYYYSLKGFKLEVVYKEIFILFIYYNIIFYCSLDPIIISLIHTN